MIRSLVLLAWLVTVWVALWEDLSVANVASGLAAGLVLLALSPLRRTQPGSGRFRPLAAMRFALYFGWKLVEASLVVAWEVVTPRNRITEGIVAIPVRGVSDLVTTTVANAISLTPGTLTIEVHKDPTVLYVHVLHLADIEQVRRDVLYLETLAIRAFGSADAYAAVRADASAAGAPLPREDVTRRTTHDREGGSP